MEKENTIRKNQEKLNIFIVTGNYSVIFMLDK